MTDRTDRTRLIASATRRGRGRRPVAPPIERASTLLNGSPAAMRDESLGPVYGIEDLSAARELRTLLAELEGLCARYACDRMTDAERKALDQVHAAAASVVARDDHEGWPAANMAFHEILYEGSRNPYLRQEILRMRARTQAYRLHAFGAVGRLQTSHDHHGLILKAIMAKDSRAAAAAGFGHMSPGDGAPGVTALIMNLPKELLG